MSNAYYIISIPMTNLVNKYEDSKRQRAIFPVKPGLEVRITSIVREGSKERNQVFEGLVVATHGAGNGKTFTVRRVVGGIGVERIFPMYSPLITNVEITGATKVRKSKLNYLRVSNVKRRRKEDQKALQKALGEIDAQRKAAEKAKKEAEEKELEAKKAAEEKVAEKQETPSEAK